MVIINVYYQDVDRKSEYPTKSYWFLDWVFSWDASNSKFYLLKDSYTVSRFELTHNQGLLDQNRLK